MSSVAPLTAASQPFWSSTLALGVVAGACALLVGLTVGLLLYQHSGRGALRDRVGEFLSPPPSAPHTDSAAGRGSRLLARTERSLERERWWGEFKAKLEFAGIERPAIEIVYITAACSLAGAAVMIGLARSFFAAVVILLAGPLVARALINRRLERQRNDFGDQLPGHLQEMSAAIRAGHSLGSAIAVMVENASEPTRREFQRVIADEQLGLALQDTLRTVAARMRARDMEQVALVAELHQRTGGNMAEVLDRVAEAVRDRAELNRELRALTAQARVSRAIVSGMPVFLLGVIYLFDSSYLSPLFHTTLGNALLVLGACMIGTGWLVMGRIAQIEV